MKVKELIAELSKCDPELTVLLYESMSEDGGVLRHVSTTEDRNDKDTWNYHKADHPFSHTKNVTDKVVTLST